MGLVPWFPPPVNLAELESSMSSVQIEQKSYEMPPGRRGSASRIFSPSLDVERSARYYEKVFGARILTMGDGNAPLATSPAGEYLDDSERGGGPTPDKPTVSLSVPGPESHYQQFYEFPGCGIFKRA